MIVDLLIFAAIFFSIAAMFTRRAILSLGWTIVLIVAANLALARFGP